MALDWLLLIILSILWGSSFFFNSISLRELPILSIVTYRLLLGSLFLFCACYFMGLRVPFNRHCIKLFIVMGLLSNALPFLLIVWGQQHISSGLASILISASPLFTLFLAHYLIAGEKITQLKLLSLLLGMFGVSVMLSSEVILLFRSDIVSFTNIIAQLSILLAALCYGFANVYGRVFKSINLPPLVAATGQVTASFLLLLPFSLYFEPPWELMFPSFSVLFSLLSLGIFSTSLAYIIFYRIINSAGSVNLSLVSFLIPIVSILLGTLILGEKLYIHYLSGFLLIILSLVLIDGRIKAVLHRLFG